MTEAKTFKLQVHIPMDLYEQMLAITGHEGEHFNGRIYGGLSKLTILALRQFLQQAQQQPTMTLEDI